VGGNSLVFLRRQRLPQRLVLALTSAKPTVAILADWASVSFGH
jgi:hypothetical protein